MPTRDIYVLVNGAKVDKTVCSQRRRTVSAP
ncbi:paREP2a [Pyrobaculum aerophilum str. IM2]|uniref:PaREP2a n=1 Tax=Pyrobaculum aerophilum (strain ATCC 51768 / DSM 7523 / JCM 9630 / CIP 104966 / NBRC 100827 / IM2) TaxID=178306 RepID=Q8ZWV2_PYRAE|nr:paREP2a [Pyrobaculum aerophilum str. IM2]